jgi:hypothetical protein
LDLVGRVEGLMSWGVTVDVWKENNTCTSSDFTLSRKSFLEYVIVLSSLEGITRDHGFSKGST